MQHHRQMRETTLSRKPILRSSIQLKDFKMMLKGQKVAAPFKVCSLIISHISRLQLPDISSLKKCIELDLLLKSQSTSSIRKNLIRKRRKLITIRNQLLILNLQLLKLKLSVNGEIEILLSFSFEKK